MDWIESGYFEDDQVVAEWIFWGIDLFFVTNVVCTFGFPSSGYTEWSVICPIYRKN